MQLGAKEDGRKILFFGPGVCVRMWERECCWWSFWVGGRSPLSKGIQLEINGLLTRRYCYFAFRNFFFSTFFKRLDLFDAGTAFRCDFFSRLIKEQQKIPFFRSSARTHFALPQDHNRSEKKKDSGIRRLRLWTNSEPDLRECNTKDAGGLSHQKSKS